MSAHFFSLLDFKKAFEDAKAYHNYAIKNGTPEIKAAHLAHHIKSGDYTILAKNNKQSTSKKGS